MSNTLTQKQRRGHALAFLMFLEGSNLETFSRVVTTIRLDDEPRETMFDLTSHAECIACGSVMELGVDGNRWKGRCKTTIATRDHLIPQTQIKIHDWSNTVLCCASCNETKGTADWRQFYSKATTILAWQQVADEWQEVYRAIMYKVKI